MTPPCIGQITAHRPLTVALIFLRIADFGLARKGVDLLLQSPLGPGLPLMPHGLPVGGIGLDHGAIQCISKSHHPYLLTDEMDL